MCFALHPGYSLKGRCPKTNACTPIVSIPSFMYLKSHLSSLRPLPPPSLVDGSEAFTVLSLLDVGAGAVLSSTS